MSHERWLPLMLIPFTMAELTECGKDDPAPVSESRPERTDTGERKHRLWKKHEKKKKAHDPVH